MCVIQWIMSSILNELEFDFNNKHFDRLLVVFEWRRKHHAESDNIKIPVCHSVFCVQFLPLSSYCSFALLTNHHPMVVLSFALPLSSSFSVCVYFCHHFANVMKILPWNRIAYALYCTLSQKLYMIHKHRFDAMITLYR